MAANLGTQESYPTATTGGGIPAWISLSGTGIANANPETSAANGVTAGGNNTYKVTLSLTAAGGNASSVAVTAQLVDNLNVNQTSSPGTPEANSYNANPVLASGTQESYPAPNATVGEVATVGAVTNNSNGTFSATVTAQNKGQAVVEFEYPFGANTAGTIAGGHSDGVYNTSGFVWPKNQVYAQLLVTVVA